MPISCHFRHCKALLVTSLTHVSGAIASVQTFTFNRTVLRTGHSLNLGLSVNRYCEIYVSLISAAPSVVTEDV